MLPPVTSAIQQSILLDSGKVSVSATSLNKDIKIPYPLPLKLGGYQVHTIPNIYIPRDRVIFPGFQVDLINTHIDPHRPIEPKIAAILHRYFNGEGVNIVVRDT